MFSTINNLVDLATHVFLQILYEKYFLKEKNVHYLCILCPGVCKKKIIQNCQFISGPLIRYVILAWVHQMDLFKDRNLQKVHHKKEKCHLSQKGGFSFLKFPISFFSSKFSLIFLLMIIGMFIDINQIIFYGFKRNMCF